MWSAVGLLFDILGFVVLFYNGNFARNFNRLDGFVISSQGSDGEGGGMQALVKKDRMPKILDHVGFVSIVLGFVFQFIGVVLGLWAA